MSICVGGIVVIIFRLFALTANQLARLRKAVQQFGKVSVVIHLDKTPGEDVRSQLVPGMNAILYTVSNILMLL
jgi:hypothetical protein